MLNGLNVMVDLETLGTGNDAVILSIGAVKFTAGEIVDEFHVGVDAATCQQVGLTIDAATVLWWFEPDKDAARAALLALEKVDVGSALAGFSQWFGPDPLPIWGNGATFDNVIMRSAYAACHMEYPTRFWSDLCYRTIKGLAPQIRLVREGTHHDALDDARSQAKHLQAIVHHLTIKGIETPPNEGAVELLAKAGRQFRMYESTHKAKGTPEGDAKADVNRQMAEEIESLLGAIA